MRSRCCLNQLINDTICWKGNFNALDTSPTHLAKQPFSILHQLSHARRRLVEGLSTFPCGRGFQLMDFHYKPVSLGGQIDHIFRISIYQGSICCLHQCSKTWLHIRILWGTVKMFNIQSSQSSGHSKVWLSLETSGLNPIPVILQKFCYYESPKVL